MTSQLLSDEVAVSLGNFFFGAAGPSHSTITRCFTACGLADEAPYDASTGTPNKEQRVLIFCQTTRRRPGDVSARALDQLLTALRVGGTFESADPKTKDRVATQISARSPSSTVNSTCGHTPYVLTSGHGSTAHARPRNRYCARAAGQPPFATSTTSVAGWKKSLALLPCRPAALPPGHFRTCTATAH